MNDRGSGNAGATSLEQLIALNDELAALVRAGIPVERGLAEVGRDLPGRSGDLAAFLGARMSAGESLSTILASDETRFPPVWRAVVAAGLRSGHLSVALESLSTTARRVAESRKLLGAALLYPLLVVAFAYAMFVFQVTRLMPTTARVYQSLTGASQPLLTTMAWLGSTASWWAIWLPVVVISLLAAWWYRSSRVFWSQSRGAMTRRSRLWPGSWPTVGRALRDGRLAAFAEVLSLLIKQQVPVPEALVLAADASGDRGLRQASRTLAERLRRGEVVAGRESLPPEFPPLLGWLLTTSQPATELSQALSRTAAAYRERAARVAGWTAIYLPILLTVLFGGTATLVQALATFGPIWRLMYDLAGTI